MPLSHSPDELSAWLRLSLEPGIGPVTARELLSAFGLPEQIYASAYGALAARLPESLARQLRAPIGDGVQALVARTLEWVAGDGRHILTLADPGYPPALLQSHDPPILLYIVGDPSVLARRAVAIVGARSATLEGLSNARAFARHLAQRGWCVTSGLALGIDAAAHEGALDAGAQGAGTLAVIGTGADIVYPARNRALAHRIAAGGAIVSELPLGTPAVAHQFPRRNRLVAGLSHGVLVVEAAVHSGSLITARLATESGREVFAIPGSIHSPLSRGCHALIRQGAKLVETAHDILVELGDATRAPAQASASDGDPSDGDPSGGDPSGGDSLLRAMGHGPVRLDDLAARSGMAAPALQARLLELELAGEVSRLPGGRFQRRAAP